MVNQNNIVKEFWEKIENIKIGMLVTETEESNLRSRPMYTHLVEDQNQIWFACRWGAPKNSEILHHKKVNVAYSDVADNIFISVSGIASIVSDNKEIQRFLEPDKLKLESLEEWFPKDPHDPNLAIIKLKVELAEYWNSGSGIMESIGNYLKSKVSDKNTLPKEKEHEKIQFTTV